MTDAQRYAPSEIDLELPFGTVLFRLGALQIAKLQEARGTRIRYPDGAEGKKPKPLGAIVREHMAGIGGQMPNLVADSYFGEYDAGDSREVILQGMIGGEQLVTPEGQVRTLTEMEARRLVIEEVDPWPTERKWELATAILIACTQGFQPPKTPGEEDDPGNAAAAPGTSSSTSPPPPET